MVINNYLNLKKDMEQFNNWTVFSELKNVTLNETIKQQLQKYYEILVTENQKYNLTTITKIDEVFTKHFLDSMLFTNHQKLSNEKVADLGTGAGFPGLVLKIFYPKLKLTLVESNLKKVNFLNLVIEQLKLTDVEVFHFRAEEYAILNYEKFDIVLSRAVAYLDIILEIGVQLLKVGGWFILLKGPKANQEINRSQKLVSQLNLKLDYQQNLVDNQFGTRINLFYKKEGHTDKKYPRKYQVIKKESGQYEK